MLLPLLVPWFKVNQDLRLLLIEPSARLISTTTNRTRNLPFNITESATRLMKTSSSQSPSLSWKLMKKFVQKPPKIKPVLEDKTLKVLFKKKPVASFNPNRIPQSRLRTLSPLTNHKALQKWLCVIDVLWDVEDEDEESWTPISLFLVLCTLESICQMLVDTSN
jgi:hypothetical protein